MKQVRGTLRSMADDEGDTMALALRDVATKSAANMGSALKEVFNNIDNRVEATAPKNGEAPKKNHILLRGLRYTMSD